jgi:ubiquitin-conjugating enzyme E2 M
LLSGGPKPRPNAQTPGQIRMQKDLAELDIEGVATIAFPNPNNIMIFDVVVKPKSGYWKGGTYTFSFRVSPGYPHDQPEILCKTKIYHPNIDYQGKLCLSILRDGWKPTYDLNYIIIGGFTNLFHDPEGVQPLNVHAGELLLKDKSQFERKVKETLQGRSFDGQSFDKFI